MPSYSILPDGNVGEPSTEPVDVGLYVEEGPASPLQELAATMMAMNSQTMEPAPTLTRRSPEDIAYARTVQS
jgi:hypothetical protein